MRAMLKALLLGLAISVLLTPAKAQTQLTIMVFQGVQNLPAFRRADQGLLRPARARGRDQDCADL